MFTRWQYEQINNALVGLGRGLKLELGTSSLCMRGMLFYRDRKVMTVELSKKEHFKIGLQL